MDEKIKTLATKEGKKTLATKVELKAEQDKIINLETHDLSYFLGKVFFLVMMVLKICFFYQPTLRTLKLKKDKTTDYVLS